MSHFFRHIFSYALLGLLWLLHFLPLPVLRTLSFCIAHLLFPLIGSRKRTVLTNLRLCFPELSPSEHKRLAKRHFVAFVCALFDRTKLWWSSRAYLSQMITMRGREHLAAAGHEAIIILTPHFVGLDAAGVGVAMDHHAASMYSRQRNPIFDAVFFAGRMRFNAPILLERQDGLRKAVKALKEGIPFFYLPDMDLGAKDAVFVPFFGVPAATIVGVSRLARITRAKIVPCIARMTKNGYEVTLDEPWNDFPSGDEAADTARMNAYIEAQVRTMPEQYYWVHRRFKTRPPGEARIY